MEAKSKYDCWAAGQGFEPRYSPPKGDVLPLDDPASSKEASLFLPHKIASSCLNPDVVTPEGLEPSTIALKGHCSTIELRGLLKMDSA